MKVLRVRVVRVRRLGRSLLRHLRTSGFDRRANELRLRFAGAVARLGALVALYADDPSVVEVVWQVRLGVLGLTDQIDAMAEALRERQETN